MYTLIKNTSDSRKIFNALSDDLEVLSFTHQQINHFVDENKESLVSFCIKNNGYIFLNFLVKEGKGVSAVRIFVNNRDLVEGNIFSLEYALNWDVKYCHRVVISQPA